MAERHIVQKATDVRSPTSTVVPLQILAQFCYEFPRYSLAEARKLPYKRIKLLMGEAARVRAARNYSLLQIIMTPHAKDPTAAYQQLLKHYQDLLDG